MTIFYIAGDGRSGSTLVDTILSNSESSISIGEGYRFWKRFYEHDTTCGCGLKIEECALWKKVDQRLSDQIENYDHKDIWARINFLLRFANVPKIPQLLAEPEWASFCKTVRLFYNSIAEIENKNHIVDSSKNMGWLCILHVLVPESLKVVYLERNLQAVANSWKKEVLLPEYYDKEVYMPVKSNYLILKSWLKIKYHNRKTKKKFHIHCLKYEHLIKKPAVAIKQLETFFNVSLPIESILKKRNHGIGGNPMRSNSDNRIIINRKIDKLNELNLIEKLFFSSINILAKRII